MTTKFYLSLLTLSPIDLAWNRVTDPYSTEGHDTKNWVLLDYSNVIVHVFVPNSRAYYDLEHLWADGEPVDISEYLTPDSSIE